MDEERTSLADDEIETTWESPRGGSTIEDADADDQDADADDADQDADADDPGL